MGLAARPGRGVPAVHHAHETPADRRIPGWRTGPERWGRQSRPFTSFRRLRRTRLRVVRRDRQGLQHPGRGPWLPVDVPGRPRRRTSRARSSRWRSPTSSATRSRRLTRGRTCRAAAAPHGRLGKPTLSASARGCRRPPGGSNDSMPRRSQPRATPRGPCARNAGPGGSRANRFRAPAGGRVGIKHEPWPRPFEAAHSRPSAPSSTVAAPSSAAARIRHVLPDPLRGLLHDLDLHEAGYRASADGPFPDMALYHRIQRLEDIRDLPPRQRRVLRDIRKQLRFRHGHGEFLDSCQHALHWR